MRSGRAVARDSAHVDVRLIASVARWSEGRGVAGDGDLGAKPNAPASSQRCRRSRDGGGWRGVAKTPCSHRVALRSLSRWCGAPRCSVLIERADIRGEMEGLARVVTTPPRPIADRSSELLGAGFAVAIRMAVDDRGCVKTRRATPSAKCRPSKSRQDRFSRTRRGSKGPRNCSATEFSHSLDPMPTLSRRADWPDGRKRTWRRLL